MSKNITIILGEFHKKEVTEMLVEARKVAKENNLTIIEEIWVNGSYEKPLALKRVLQKQNIDGAVLLGIIERGETKHGLVMGQVVMQAVISLELEFMKPIGIGILGPEILPDQIPPRLLPHARQAVCAVAQMLKE
jgi:6,7-dimethyl-8-ribityllumazine synthase